MNITYYWEENLPTWKPLIQGTPVYIRYSKGTLMSGAVSPFLWNWDSGDLCWRCDQDPMAISHDEFVEAWSYS